MEPTPVVERIGTARLEATPVTLADVATLASVWNDETVRRVHGLGLEPLPDEAVRRWLVEPGRAMAWIARQRATLAPVGVVEMGPVGPDAFELGIALVASARGRGYGRELIAALCRWAFDRRGAAEVVAEMRFDNEAARRAFTACGFVADAGGGDVVRMWRRSAAHVLPK